MKPKQISILHGEKSFGRGTLYGLLIATTITMVACSSEEQYSKRDNRQVVHQRAGSAEEQALMQIRPAISIPSVTAPATLNEAVAGEQTSMQKHARSGAARVDQSDVNKELMNDESTPSIKYRQLLTPGIVAVPDLDNDADSYHSPRVSTEKYQEIEDNPIVLTSKESTSTFSIDVDTGAYSNVRRFLEGGQLPPHDAVRIEEMVNYFTYDYPVPESTDVPFSVTTELAVNPWNNKTRLLHIGLQGYKPESSERPPANLVFLIDVSGSMRSPNKLDLLKTSIKMLSRQLTEKDTVSIAVYAGASGVVLKPTAGSDTRTIVRALDNLSAGGSTNGEGGIRLAYDLAEENFKSTGINRVILATDGDFNVGISNIDRLKSLIERKRESGVALTTLGFGTGNYNDHMMEQLADTGNGAYAYIDTLNEARKVLVDELDAHLMTIASDVKIQIEFNPQQVSEYRLIGYVNRRLQNEDFNNDKVDAGEIGAGHTVTALYEIALAGEGGERHSEKRYKTSAVSGKSAGDSFSGELAELRLRYKEPGEQSSELISSIIGSDSVIKELDKTSDNFRFSAAVAAFGQKLRNAKYMGDYSLLNIADLATAARGEDRFGYRSGFIQLLQLADTLHAPVQARGDNENMDGTDDSGASTEG